MMTFRTRSIAALGAVVATFATVSASAPAQAETRSAMVRYGDLVLSSPAGAARLHRRIRAAADRVCGPQEALLRQQIAECRRAAIAQAEARIPAQPTQLAQR